MGSGTFEEQLRLILAVDGADALKVLKGFQKELEGVNKLNTAVSKSDFAGIKERLTKEGKEKVALTKKEFMDKVALNKEYMKNYDASKKTEFDTAQRSLTSGLKAQEKYLDNTQANARRFKAEYLSIMFAGMALQRTFGGLFKNMVKDYKELTKESITPLSSAMTRLEANWKFLKFAMMDAASPFLSSLANGLADMLHSFAKMNPDTLKWFAYAIGSLALIGGGAAAFGQGALLFSSMVNVGATKQLTETLRQMAGINAKDMTAANAMLTTIGKIAGTTVAVIAVLALNWQILSNESTLKDRLIGVFGTALGGAIIGGLFGGVAGAGIGFGIGLLVGTVSMAIDFFLEEKPSLDDFKQIFKDMFSNLTNFSLLFTDAGKMILAGKLFVKMQTYFDKGENEGDNSAKELADNFGTTFDEELTPDMEKFFANVSTTGVKAFTTDLKSGVSEFLNDSENGMVALQNAAEKLNEELGKTVTKTVKIKSTGYGGNGDIGSINTTTRT